MGWLWKELGYKLSSVATRRRIPAVYVPCRVHGTYVCTAPCEYHDRIFQEWTKLTYGTPLSKYWLKFEKILSRIFCQNLYRSRSLFNLTVTKILIWKFLTIFCYLFCLKAFKILPPKNFTRHTRWIFRRVRAVSCRAVYTAHGHTARGHSGGGLGPFM